MTNNLITIDQGNTAAKVTVFTGGAPVDTLRAAGKLPLELLLPLLERYAPYGVVYSSAAGIDAKLVESLRHICGSVLVLTPGTPLPIKIGYSTPATLGMDRIANAVAAARRLPGVAALVVDAGTCVTLDVVSAEGELVGGNISPGLGLRFKALHAYTDALPLCTFLPEVEPFGSTTQRAIQAGVQWGLKAEIEAAFRKAKEMHGATRLVMTGGDAPQLAELLETSPEELVLEPHLQASGLHYIFDYNYTNEDY